MKGKSKSDPRLKALTVQDIRDLCSERIFERGQEYYATDCVTQPAVSGNTLRAMVTGTEDYITTVAVDEDEDLYCECTCPYDWEAFCKHGVALLLHWVRKPEDFQDLGKAADALVGKSKEELIEIIGRMAEASPEAAALLREAGEEMSNETKVKGKQTAAEKVRLDAYESKVGQAFYGDFVDYYHMDQLLDRLEAIQRTAERYQAKGDYENAATVYRALINVGVDRYGSTDDSSGGLAMLIDECFQAYAECLPHCPMDKEEFLTGLVELWIGEDYGFSDRIGGLIREHCRSDEEYGWAEARLLEEKKKLDEQWAALAKPPQEKGKKKNRYDVAGDDQAFHVKYHLEKIVDFLLTLYNRQGNKEKYNHLCRHSVGVDAKYAHQLIANARSGRRKADAVGYCLEGIRAARAVDDYLSLVRELAALGELDTAVRTLEEDLRGRLPALPKFNLPHQRRSALELLADLYREAGRTEEALQWYLQNFRESPDLKTFVKVKEATQGSAKLAQEKKAEMLQHLAQKNMAWLLVDIYLHEEDLSAAVKAAHQLRDNDTQRINRVAEAAEKSSPAEAIELYKKIANAFLTRTGNRATYREGVKHLRKVKTVYQKLGRMSEWDAYITQLRKLNTQRAAALDEMKGI